MFSRKTTASTDRAAEDVEFDADSDSLLALESSSLSYSDSGGSAYNAQDDYRRWMAALLDNSHFHEYFDVEFKLKQTISGNEYRGVVSAHKLILATRNRQFAEVFRKEKGREIVLFEPDIPVETFKSMVKYIYTGQIEFPRKVIAAASLLYAAKKYQVEPLYTMVKSWLLNRIPRAQTRHLILIFQRALDLHLIDLIPLCSHLVEQRTVDIVKDPHFMNVRENFIGRLLDLNTFTGISEREMFERILHWGHVQLAEQTSVKGKESPTLRSILDPIIHKFCLASIPKDPLAQIITETGIFTEKEQLDISLFLLGRKKDLGQFSARQRKINHRDLVAMQMPPPDPPKHPKKAGNHVKHGFRKLAQKSKSVTDLSKIGLTEARDDRRHTSQISLPLGPPEHRFTVHADMNYYIDDLTRTDTVVRTILANLPTPTCSSPSSSTITSRSTRAIGDERNNWFRAAFTDVDSSNDDVSLPRPFVRRMYRKTKLITGPPAKPTRKGLGSIFSAKSAVVNI